MAKSDLNEGTARFWCSFDIGDVVEFGKKSIRGKVVHEMPAGSSIKREIAKFIKASGCDAYIPTDSSRINVRDYKSWLILEDRGWSKKPVLHCPSPINVTLIHGAGDE